MARAQGRGRRRFPGLSRKNAPPQSGLGVGRARALGGDSKYTKSTGSEKAKTDSTTTGLQH